MQLKPEEISKVIRSQIKYYENAIRQDETGTVLMVGDGIARASGLSNCMAGCWSLRMEAMEWHRTSRKTAYLSFYSVPARTSARDSL